MVVDASDLAQTQLREAEAALAARAADMASAAGEAQDAARSAADDLARQTIRLETAGSGVADQIRAVEEGLSEQRAALVQSAFGLRRDQEDFSAHRGILHRIRNQIDEHLFEPVAVPVHIRLIDLIQADMDFIPGKNCHFLEDFGQEKVQLNAFHIERKFA